MSVVSNGYFYAKILSSGNVAITDPYDGETVIIPQAHRRELAELLLIDPSPRDNKVDFAASVNAMENT